MESLKTHLPDCNYREGNLPDWFRTYVKSCEAELGEAEFKEALVLGQEEFEMRKEE